LLFSSVMIVVSLQARQISQQDIILRSGRDISFGSVQARVVKFGGYTTPECKLAISLDGRYFYLTKMRSTCWKGTNRKGVKIICNSNKSVCKTRSELIDFVQGGASSGSLGRDTTPRWCSSSHLNATERTICATPSLARLDQELARIYGSAKAHKGDLGQKQWLKNERNSCGTRVSCLRDAYIDRIAVLQENRGGNASKLSSVLYETKEENPFTNDCDRLASDPNDIAYKGKSVRWYQIDIDEALRACKKAAENDKNNPRFLYQLGRVYEKNDDDAKAKEYYQLASDKDYAIAQYHLGYLFHWHFDDYKNALKYYHLAASNGIAEAYDGLASLYKYGNGVPRDSDKVEQYYQKELELYQSKAKEGSADAYFQIALMYEEGKGVKKDLEKYIYYLRKAAARGDDFAQYNLAEAYKKGENVIKNLDTYLYYLKKSADNHNYLAQFDLGGLYFNGEYVPENINRGVYLLKKSAEQNNCAAIYNLAMLYKKGMGVKRNYKETVRLLKKMANPAYCEFSSTQGSYELGLMYRDGKGVKKDCTKAMVLFGVGVVYNYEDSKKALDNLGDYCPKSR